MFSKFSTYLWGLILLIFAGTGFAKETPDAAQQHSSKTVFTEDDYTLVSVGNFNYWMRKDGQSGRNPDGNAGGIYPAGTTPVVFQDGIIYGGFVRDTRRPGLPQLRVNGQTYVVGTAAGHIITPGTADAAPIAADPDAAKIYRIRKDYQQNYLNSRSMRREAAAFFRVTDSEVTIEMQQAIWDNYDWAWQNWPVDLGAPVEADGTPGIAGADQVIWYVYNDSDEDLAENLYGSPGIGLETQVTIWAYDYPSSNLGQVIFKRYRIINKSGFRIDSMFIAQWSDTDVGDFSDDLSGCDIPRNLGFSYNGNPSDKDFAAFGLPPAAVGYDLLQGPLADGVAGQDLNRNGIDDADDFGVFDQKVVGPGKINLPMTSFAYKPTGTAIADPVGGEYDGAKAWYNWLNGFLPTPDLQNPTPYRDKFWQPTKFPVSGDPVAQTGDIDGFGLNPPPGGRRFATPSGPFTMMPGDTQEVVIAVIGGIVFGSGESNLNAVAQLKQNSDVAQLLYNAGFKATPAPPDPPVVHTTPLENKIVLEWGSDPAATAATEARDPLLGFHFEGYNVYQIPLVGGNPSLYDAVKIATFDLNNGITIVESLVFLPEYGSFARIPVQIGSDTGIQRFLVIENDALNDHPLQAGTPYAFAVSAYNAKDQNNDGVVDSDYPESSLESALSVVTVTPQSTRPGTRYPNAPGDTLAVAKTGVSSGRVSVEIVDPAALTGDTYRIEFNEEPQYFIENGDTTDVWHTWNLVDVTTGQTLLANQINLNGDNDYLVTDGFLARVSGVKKTGLACREIEGERWISGVDWGSPWQGECPGIDAPPLRGSFFGSALGPDDLVSIRMIFQDKAEVEANGFIGKGAVYRRDQGYAFAGIGQLPFACYDISDRNNPRRVNICFVEMDGESGAAANNIWDMGADENGVFPGDLGAREYIFIMNSDYNEGVDYNDDNWGPAADVLYAIWPKNRGSRTYLSNKFTWDILYNRPHSPEDFYTFSTEAVIENDVSLAQGDVDKINVFPNPYYAENPLEVRRNQRFVTFTHLPKKFILRIFTLSGALVRTLSEADKAGLDEQFLNWDLENESGFKVGSGMYIAHISMPELNKTKVVKLFIIQAAEVLRYY